MTTELHIAASAMLTGRQMFLNGKRWHQADEGLDLPAFTREVYKKLDLNYLKFYKMDDACKQGFVTAELLIHNVQGFDAADRGRIGICIAGAYGSLDTDQKYFATYGLQDGTIPSPGLFVYTLPNILIGELCIRHKITGEQACFVVEQTQLECLYLYTRTLFDAGLVDSCIVGWNNVYDEANVCCLTWVDKADRGVEFDDEWFNFATKMHDGNEKSADANAT